MALSIFVAIGNSDDRLTQAEWSAYRQAVDLLIRNVVEDEGGTIHGAWVSPSAEPFQNACWAFSPDNPTIWRYEVRDDLRHALTLIGAEYHQRSIAWTEGYVDLLDCTS